MPVPNQPPTNGADQQQAPVYFARRDAQRIQRCVRDYERLYKYTADQRARFPVGQGGNLTIAKTTSTITARSGTTAGHGTAAIYHVGAAYALAAEAGAGATVTVVNIFGSAVASGAWVLIAIIDGQWCVIAADCP